MARRASPSTGAATNEAPKCSIWPTPSTPSSTSPGLRSRARRCPAPIRSSPSHAVPAVSLLVISIVVLVSAKARGFQEANAIGGSVILSVIRLVAAQTSGRTVLSAGLIAATALVFALADVVLLHLIVRVFKRNRIVS